MPNITVGDFTAAMWAAVHERGDGYIYDRTRPGWSIAEHVGASCVYQTPEGEPACIIGLVLTKLGFGDLLPGNDEAAPASAVLSELGFQDAAGTDGRSLGHIADMAQALQDAGKTWGETLNDYLARVVRLDPDAIILKRS